MMEARGINILMIVWIIFLLYGCNCKQGRKIENNTIKEYVIILKDSSSSYSLKIKTKYFHDSTFFKKNWVSNLNDVVFEQDLFFENHDSLISVQCHHVASHLTIKSNEYVSVLDNVIVTAAIIQGTIGAFYKIEGAGGCNTCSEYSAIYSLNGNIMNERYSSIGENINYNTGGYKEILEKYGLADDSKLSPIFTGTCIFPPKYAGEKKQIELR